jgi:hypothetical protein
MLEIKNPNFEPSKEMLSLWLYTRKKSTFHGGLQLPGLFSIYNFTMDFGFVIGMLVAEGAGVFLLADYLGFEWYILAVSIIIDIALGAIAHAKEKYTCEYKNKIVTAESNAKVALMETKITSNAIFQNIFFTLIALLALGKCFLFYVGYGAIDTFLLLPVAFYVFSAYVNITRTGYVLYTFIAQWKMNAEFSTFLKTNEGKNSVKDTIPHYFYTKEDLVLRQVGQHSLEKNPNPTEKSNYILKMCGVLTDTELQLFTNIQPAASQKAVLAKEILTLQLSLI